MFWEPIGMKDENNFVQRMLLETFFLSGSNLQLLLLQPQTFAHKTNIP